MADARGHRKIRLSTTPAPEDLAQLQLGDIVYLDGVIYTGREGVYMRAIQEGVPLPMDLPAESAANFHCAPAAAQRADGSFDMGPSPPRHRSASTNGSKTGLSFPAVGSSSAKAA